MTKAVVSICKATSFPPGISNVASNCCANSVLQCLFSHTFREMITGIFATHSKYCSIYVLQKKGEFSFGLCIRNIYISNNRNSALINE